MYKASRLPIIGSKKQEERASNFKRLLNKMKDMQGLFIHFTHNEFIYDCRSSDKLWAAMSKDDQQLFPFNVRLVDWKACLEGFQFGIRRYFVKEDTYSPESGWVQLLAKNQ